MKKSLRLKYLLAALYLLVPLVSQANDIEPGKEYYTAIKTPVPIVLDGDLSEWRGAMLLADPRFSIPKGSGDEGDLVFFELYDQGGPGTADWTGPDDHTSAVQVVYDDDNVYFGFTVTDEYHQNSNSAWNGDSVQLMIANAERDQQIALYNYGLDGNEDDGIGEIIILHEAGPGGTEAVIVRNSDTKRTIYEIKLPKESIGFEDLERLSGGVQFGLGMAINDGDKDAPGQQGWGGLGAHAIVFGKSPGETALVTLAMSNDIEPGKEYYIANPLKGEFVLDGELNEWGGVPVLSDPRFSIPKGSKRDGTLVLFEIYDQGGPGTADWTGPDDQTSAVQIAYDAENIYFGFTVTDEYHQNNNSAWNGDSVQLMIASADQQQQVALYNYGLDGNEDDGIGEVVILHEAGPGGTEAVVVRNSDTKRTVYEIKLPAASLGLESLELGTRFGLGMAINDGDKEAPGQQGWGGLGAHAIVFGKSPNETALVTLGVGGASGDQIFLSAINVSLDTFSFRASDKGESLVDPASAKLILNGEEVELVASDKKVDAFDFSFVSPEIFPPATTLEYLIEVSDTEGNVVTDAGTLVTPTYGLLEAPMLALDVDTSMPGFIWRIWQNDLQPIGNSIQAESALAGELEDIDGTPLVNDAYPDEPFGDATGPGVEDGVALKFEIPTTLNLSVFDGGDFGNFIPDSQMPGVPGRFFTSNGVAVEILTFIEFPEGQVIMGVNSKDGFRMDVGYVDDPANALTAGSFEGARGESDTTFLIDVRDAGIYPVRIIYYNGNGDPSFELFTVDENGDRTLVNDTDNGGLPAYRVGTVPESVEQITFTGTPVAEGADVSEATVVNFGELGSEATYEFFFTAILGGASTAIAGNDAFAIKLDQWNQQGVFGSTEFGVADNIFTAVEGQSVASVFGAPVHVVITTDASGTTLYINGVLSGTWAGNFDLSGDTKIMGARLSQETDHMGEGSTMYRWATYVGVANEAQVMAIYEARPDVNTGGTSTTVTLTDGEVTIEYTGTLQSAPTVNGPWTEVDGASSPFTESVSDDEKFYRSMQ